MVKIIKTTDVIVDNRAEEDAKEFWKQFDNMQDKINNLQSKIDKANEYIENYYIFDEQNGEYYQTHNFDKSNAKELHDILKEE